MKQNNKIVLVSLLFFLFSVTVSYAATMGIVTGSTKGTYYQFGLNLAQLLKQHDITLKVSPSNGSVENVYAVFKRPNTQLGIVQADVLAFVSRVQTDPVLRKIARKIKMVFPLYNEEIHLIGRSGLQSFADLQGKRVAVGKEGSGTYLTARLLFEISGIQPAEMVTVGTNEALAGLKNGTLDAMFYVAGYPVKLLTTDITAEDNLVLLPIQNKEILGFYPRTTIPAGTYSWQKEAVPTVAVKAVLISFNFRNVNCENVGRVGKLLYENMDWLKQNGHPKWRAVDLDFPLKGWQQYDCVAKKLTTVPAFTGKPNEVNPVLEAIKNVLQE
ncbi:MAG TPA: TAXI family TRAP transporter solute-binding subunit [Desulfobulbus sp.]|nr:TAXI family TRAP transporter solute-binding subunit [Desulfobulbus sp.]